jgi:surface carbohydrate biosynthesis protein
MNKTNNQRRILLVVPKPVRDLEGHALVSYYLRRQFGHDVRLHTGPDAEKAFFDYAPDALVLDWVGYSERLREAELAKAAGVKLCVLPTAGVFPDDAGFLRGAGEANGASKLIDCYLSWGEFAAEAIVRERVLSGGRVEITGCPRFDFYANQRLATIGERDTFFRSMGVVNSGSPVILWCTGTNNYNNLDRDPERFVYSTVASGGVTEAEARLQLEDERKQMEAHSELVRELARRHPEWNFVVKIHPLEHRRFYLDWCRGSTNIFIAPNRPIREFVFHCDTLLQRGCTTATEFWTRGKPVLELRMGDFQTQWAPPEHMAGNHSVFTLEEADRTISGYLNGGPVPLSQRLAREFYLQKFLYRIDGLSGLRCARRINREVTAPLYTDEDQSRNRTMIAKIHQERREERRQSPLSSLKQVVGIPRHRTLRPWKRSFWTRSPEIDEELLTRLYGQYRRALEEEQSAARSEV